MILAIILTICNIAFYLISGEAINLLASITGILWIMYEESKEKDND